MDFTRTSTVAVVTLAVLGAVLLTGCGSTKIYTQDKTVEYQGSIYNVSEARQLSTRVEGTAAVGDVVNLQGYDSKRFEALVKERGPITVSSIISLDDKDIVYEQKQLQKGRDFSRMQESLQDAYEDLARFMADGKKTQLKLE